MVVRSLVRAGSGRWVLRRDGLEGYEGAFEPGDIPRRGGQSSSRHLVKKVG
jgi:hypothetical protein